MASLPPSADAHTTVKGMGEFVSGALHPVTTPAHILILLGLGLLAGQRAPESIKPPMLAFAAVSAVALGLCIPRLISGVYQPLLLALALCLGILVAMELRPKSIVVIALFSAAAAAIGLDSGPDAGSYVAVIKTLLGTWICLLVVVFDLAAYVAYGAKQKWIRIGVRVLGSWIIAISLLVLAFALKKKST